MMPAPLNTNQKVWIAGFVFGILTVILIVFILR